MDDYNRVITNSCLQSHYIWKSFRKMTQETPQLTEELSREGSVKQLNPTAPCCLHHSPYAPTLAQLLLPVASKHQYYFLMHSSA